MNGTELSFYLPPLSLILLALGFVFRLPLFRVVGYCFLLVSTVFLYRYILPHKDFTEWYGTLQVLICGLLLIALIGLWGERMNESLIERVKWPSVLLILCLIFILWSRHPLLQGSYRGFYHNSGSASQPSPP